MTNELQKRILSSIILIPVVLFLLIKGSYFFDIFLLICLLFTIYEWYLISKKKFYCLPGLIYISISFYFAYLLRNDFNGKYTLFLLILIICVSTDIGGYIFGKILKGPKLTKISPNKTYTGMVGGFILSFVSASIYLNYSNYYIIDSTGIYNFYNSFFVIIISMISQIGDILISYFKRKSKIKNTGNIIPGHGGILDRIDGMIFAFPSTFLILKVFN
tara:strand:- start:257 stop:907 length:651 start_codon:yes stop_codon:yes gene_type:complete